MNAQELYRADGKAAGVFYCETCRIIHIAKDAADLCCAPHYCETCGVEVKRFHSFCSSCSEKHAAEKERQRFEKATKLTSWDGPVWVDGCGYNEGFFESVDHLLEYLGEMFGDLDVEEEVPKYDYAWTCHVLPTCALDCDHIIENATDEAHDGFDISDLDGVDELRAAIEKFNEANSGVVSWSPDMKVCVLLPKKEAC